MAGGFTYKPDIAATGVVMRSEAMQDMLRSRAEKGAEFARSIAPRRTGDYAASFRVETKARGGLHGDRAEAQLVNDSPHALLVESWDDYHVLARAAAFIEAGE